MIKYIAGMFDADGSVFLKWWKEKDWYRFTLQIEFSQQIGKRDWILDEIRDYFGFGIIREKEIKNKYKAKTLTFTGNEALRVAEQIHKYCVIKGDYVRYLIDVYKNLRGRYTKEQKNKLEVSRKIKRKEQNTKKYNYPSKQWLAGYIDGDGSLHARWDKFRERTQFFLRIDAADWDAEGIMLIHKVFGGRVWKRKNTNVVTYSKYLGKEHIEKILKPLAKHCKLKNKQAERIIYWLRRVNGKLPRDAYKDISQLNAPATTE